MNNRLIQAYRQAPWRNQLQWIGMFTFVLILLASVAWVYVSVSAQAAKAGRDIQFMQRAIALEKQNLADKRYTLAQVTSDEVMLQRADNTGFDPDNGADTVFVVVDGYSPRQSPELAPAPGPGIVHPSLITTDYTQSLWDWVFNNFSALPVFNGGIQP
jgi:hypothetical protein